MRCSAKKFELWFKKAQYFKFSEAIQYNCVRNRPKFMPPDLVFISKVVPFDASCQVGRQKRLNAIGSLSSHDQSSLKKMTFKKCIRLKGIVCAKHFILLFSHTSFQLTYYFLSSMKHKIRCSVECQSFSFSESGWWFIYCQAVNKRPKGAFLKNHTRALLVLPCHMTNHDMESLKQKVTVMTFDIFWRPSDSNCMDKNCWNTTK